jgi:hypothetical protein
MMVPTDKKIHPPKVAIEEGFKINAGADFIFRIE